MARQRAKPEKTQLEDATDLANEAKALDARRPAQTLSEESLLSHYQGFIIKIVASIYRQLSLGADHRDDMLADGNLGLIEAWRRFDPDQRGAFSTYAYYRVKGNIIDGLRKRGVMRRSRTRIKAKLTATASRLGEAQAHPSTPRQRLKNVDNMVRQMTAANLCVYASELESDASAKNPLRRVIDAEAKERLMRRISHLPEPELTLIRAVYFQERSLTDVGNEMGFSRSWACRLHARALMKLQELMGLADASIQSET